MVITAAALAVGIELGLQPVLFQQDGHPLYSPVATPAMLLSHTFGASLVEALITALGFACIQKQHQTLLTALGEVANGGEALTGEAQALPLW